MPHGQEPAHVPDTDASSRTKRVGCTTKPGQMHHLRVLTKHGEKSGVWTVSSTLCSSHICGIGLQQRQDIWIPYAEANNSEESS